MHMGRTARIVVPGIPHHVTQRGNRCEDVFFCDRDRRVYLELLRTYAEIHGLLVHNQSRAPDCDSAEPVFFIADSQTGAYAVYAAWVADPNNAKR